MKRKFKKYLSVFFVFSLLTGGAAMLGGGEASAKSVIKSNDYDVNKITGSKGDPYNYIYFSVPESAYLSKRASAKLSSGIIHDTYRSYWIYYSSSTGKYYP